MELELVVEPRAGLVVELLPVDPLEAERLGAVEHEARAEPTTNAAALAHTAVTNAVLREPGRTGLRS